MSQNIIWLRPDGGISVEIPQVSDIDMEKWRDELIARGGDHAGWKAVAINAEVPGRCEFRNAMVWDGKRVAHDMARARDLRREQLRHERQPHFKDLDIAYLYADEKGDAKAKTAIVTRKQALRDITKHPALDKAETLDDLRAVKVPAA